MELRVWDERMLAVMQHQVASGITKKEWCRTVGILPNNIHDIKKGKRSFTVEQIFNCCRSYRVNPGWIFGMSEVMSAGEKVTAMQSLKAAVKAVEEEMKKRPA